MSNYLLLVEETFISISCMYVIYTLTYMIFNVHVVKYLHIRMVFSYCSQFYLCE